MGLYRIIIGRRELDIHAPSLEEACHAASLQYPGEAISGFYSIPEDPEPGSAELESESDPQGRAE